MKRRHPRDIRVDDSHTIKLRVSKWFPEMTILTVALAFAGSFFYGDLLSSSSSFSAGVLPEEESVPVKKIARKEPKAVKVVPAVVIRKDVEPRIIGAETKMPNIKLELESTSIVGDSARVTYRIYNTGKTTVGGSTWAIGDNPNQPLNKQILPWKARTFTRKTASFPLSSTSPGEFKIFVSDDVAKVANSYTVRF
jgi:hypothetical protein